MKKFFFASVVVRAQELVAEILRNVPQNRLGLPSLLVPYKIEYGPICVLDSDKPYETLVRFRIPGFVVEVICDGWERDEQSPVQVCFQHTASGSTRFFEVFDFIAPVAGRGVEELCKWVA